MSTKTFKLGEYGFNPKYKLTTKGQEVEVVGIGWDNEVAIEYTFHLGSLGELESWLYEQTTSYYTDTIIQWVKSTKEYSGCEKPKSIYNVMFRV